MKKYLISMVLLFIFSVDTYSQSIKAFNNNSTVQRTSHKTCFLISVKAGFHTAYDKDNDAGFNSGLIFSGNADIGLTENFYAGISYEFWNHSREVSDISNNNIKYTRNSTGSNVSINIAWKTNFDEAGIYLGFGVGSYTVTSGGSGLSYLNFKFLTGLDINLSKMFLLSTDIAYNAMTKYNLVEESDKASMFSFKIGPTLVLY